MDDQANSRRTEGATEKRGGATVAETVNVNVTPSIAQGNSVYCEITRGTGTGENHVKGGVIKLPGAGPYTINFALQAGSVPDLSWCSNASGGCNAFWSNAAGCPGDSEQDAQVTHPPSSNGDTVTLTITPDPNLGRNVLHYALNFDQDGGPRPLQFDPIIIVGSDFA